MSKNYDDLKDSINLVINVLNKSRYNKITFKDFSDEYNRLNTLRTGPSKYIVNEALENLTEEDLPDNFELVEKNASGTLDNWERLILQMHMAADNWDAE